MKMLEHSVLRIRLASLPEAPMVAFSNPISHQDSLGGFVNPKTEVATELRKDESDLIPLVTGDTVQRGDVFISDGQRYEMSRVGVVLGVLCLGKIIRKDNGGWHRPSKKH